MIIVKIVLIAAVVLYVGLTLLLYLLQERMIFFPTREIHVTPAQRGLGFEELTLVADDGVRIAAWFVPAPHARGTVLYLHGNGGNLSHAVEAIETYVRLGVNVLAIDYRGYGASDGRPTGVGIERDAEAAWRYLREVRSIGRESIVVVGRSLGGGPASMLAARHAPAGLILESTFTSVSDRAAEHFPFIPVRAFLRTRFDVRANVASVQCPLLVVHSTDDETIPYHHGVRLFESAREPKELVTIAHGHNDCFARSSSIYIPSLDRFLTTVLDGD